MDKYEELLVSLSELFLEKENVVEEVKKEIESL